MAKETKNPDYIVYFVPHRKNAYWTRIGAAWNHKRIGILKRPLCAGTGARDGHCVKAADSNRPTAPP